MLKKKEVQPSALDEAINRILESLEQYEPDSDEYGVLVTRLDRLHAMKIAETHNQRRISPDTLVTVGANLAGIVLILGFERAHIITSKALSFVLKSKV